MESQALRNCVRVLFSIAIVCAFSTAGHSQQKSRGSSDATAQRTRALNTYRNLDRPLTFEVNQGQFDSRARFASHAPGYELLLMPGEVEMSLSKPRVSQDARRRNVTRFEHAGTVDVKLEGANPKATIAGEGELAARSNYYVGNDHSKWHVGVPNYSRVRYRGVYPGIDLVYYGKQRLLEHDFVVAPGANPKRIRLALSGAKSVKIDGDGDLVMEVGDGSVRLMKPVVYQEIEGKRHEISGRYELAADRTATFALGKYDKRRTLVIDPKLNYATYLGGSGTELGLNIAVQGSVVYVAGNTTSSDFPVVGSPVSSGGGCFVSAIDLTAGFMYSTYISAEGCGPIGVDLTGNAYVSGSANDATLPIMTSGLPGTYGGGGDGFVAKLSSSGTLLASGYLGGASNDSIFGASFDTETSHYLITGNTSSFSTSPATLPGQLYVSTDAAASWSLSSGSGEGALPGMDVPAVLIVPGSESSTYYVGGGFGAYVSSDGSSWSRLGTGTYPAMRCLVNDLSTTGSLYACVDYGGVWKFNPTANQWQPSGSGMPGGVSVTSIVVNPSTPSTVYAATNSAGVWVSTNSGATWTTLNAGLSSLDIESMAMSPGGVLYAGVGSGSGAVLYTSTDGFNWSALSGSGLPSNTYFNQHANSITFNHIGESTYIYIGLGASGGFVSADGGSSWSAMGPQLLVGHSAEINVFTVDPVSASTLYVGTNDGLWVSTDNGASFSRSDSGVVATTVHSIAIDTLASMEAEQTVLYEGSETVQGFAMALDTSLTPVFSSVFGGDGPAITSTYSFTTGGQIVADGEENVYVVGWTYSKDIPNVEFGAQPNSGGDLDGILMKMTSFGSPVWSTYLGGSGTDLIEGLAVAADGTVAVGGATTSYSDFPTTDGAYQSTCASCTAQQSFITEYDTAGDLLFSTYFSPSNGANSDHIYGVVFDNADNLYATGITGGPVPLGNPLNETASFSGSGEEQGFIAELDATGSSLLFSTLLGGGGGSSTTAKYIAIDPTNAIYITGWTSATDFATTDGAVQGTLNGPSDAFVVQVTHTGASNDIAISVDNPNPYAAPGDTVTFNITGTNNTTTGEGASDVVLASDLALTSLTSSAGDCTTSPARCAIGALAPGGTFTATATMVYGAVGTYNNVFTVRTNDDDPVPSNNTVPIIANIVTNPDLSVTLTGPGSVGAGGMITYTMTVTNNGPVGSSPFTAVLQPDESLSFVSADESCSYDGYIYCSLGSLGVRGAQSFNITFQAPSFATTVNSTADADYDGDPNPSNNEASLSTNVTTTTVTAACVSITAMQGAAITPVTMTGSGGAGGPYGFSATGLPPGLIISTDGTISGVSVATGTYNYVVTVLDMYDNAGTVNCAVTVAPPASGPVYFFLGNAISYYTIPATGNYSITVAGAQGGSGSDIDGGEGAVGTGTVSLNAGTTLEIVVGGMGLTGNFDDNWGGGGGGGTFVFVVGASQPLLVAGGGGGAGYSGTDVPGGPGQTTTAGQAGGGPGGGAGGVAGGGGAGATGDDGSFNGGGGGGWAGNGGNGLGTGTTSGTGGSGDGGFGPPTFAAGPGGGVDGEFANGGFGGGGGGGWQGGGGGGGYSGGGGGDGEDYQGGGGGSYADPSLFGVTILGGQNPSDGFAIVTTGAPEGSADLALTAGAAPVPVGGYSTFTVTVTNNGPSVASSAVLTDSLDRFQFVTATATSGSCSYDGIAVNCALGDIAVGASVTVNVSVIPPASGWASNEFHAKSASPDPNPTNNVVEMGPTDGVVTNTKRGSNVMVDAKDTSSGAYADVFFSTVTKPGFTRVISSAGTQPPAGYRFGTPALVYDVSTSAAYSGNIVVALRLNSVKFQHPEAVRLFHMEGGVWVDRTSAPMSPHGFVSATTASLSPFVMVEPVGAGPVANAGSNQTVPGASSNGATVTLNGAASSDSDGAPLTYKWTGPFPEGSGTVTGVTPKVTLPLGVSQVTLVVNDGESDSAPANVSVTVSDFTIAAPTSQIVLKAGQSASFDVVLTPKYGAFEQAVTLACGNLPAGVTCSLANNSVTPGSQGTTATVTLTASASAALHSGSAPMFGFWLGGFPVLGVLFAGKLRRKRMLIAVALLLIAGMIACGGGGQSSVQPAPTSGSTTTVTLTGTAAGLQHSSTVTIVIQ